jgi:ATP-dependent Clp protease adaptor protein ClpS
MVYYTARSDGRRCIGADRESPVNRPVGAERPGSTPTITRPDLDRGQDVKPKALLPYKVVVLDCNCHSFDDVEIALCRVIPGMTRNKAHQHAWEIHTTGASVVARAPKERADHFQEQLAARGLRVTIEPD